MSKFDRKLRRNRLKQAHAELKGQWATERERRRGLTDVVGGPVPTAAVDTLQEGGDTAAPMVETRPVEQLGRAPNLSQYKRMLSDFVANQKRLALKARSDALVKRMESEKKVDLEWKDE